MYRVKDLTSIVGDFIHQFFGLFSPVSAYIKQGMERMEVTETKYISKYWSPPPC